MFSSSFVLEGIGRLARLFVSFDVGEGPRHRPDGGYQKHTASHEHVAYRRQAWHVQDLTVTDLKQL